MLKSQQKVDIKLLKICQSHQKLASDKRSLHATLKLFANLLHENAGVVLSYLSTSWIPLNKGQPELNINDTDIGSYKPCLGQLTSLALLVWWKFDTRLTTSEFYYLDELFILFLLSFISSNNTEVETTEQFMILMHTRYVCHFSGLANFSQKLCKL